MNLDPITATARQHHLSHIAAAMRPRLTLAPLRPLPPGNMRRVGARLAVAERQRENDGR